MKEITLNEHEKSGFASTLNYVKDWCKEHQWAVGIGEMAAGAGLICAGIQMGHIHLGTDIVGVDAGGFSHGALEAAGGGGGTGALASVILGNIGVVAMGGGIGIPAWVLSLGASAIFLAAGYSVGDAVHHFLNPSVNLAQVFDGGSLLAIGVALLIDGARRLLSDKQFKEALSRFCEGVICLVELASEVVVDSVETLAGFTKTVWSSPATGLALGLGGGLAGASVGGTLAAGTVTILGSHALGGAALTLGLVSAPLWPVVAGIGVGALAVAGVWRCLCGD